MTTPDTNAIKRNILLIIQDSPQAANDKALLYSLYWKIHDKWDDDNSLYRNLKYATRPATIDRRLRELREAGLIQLSTAREKEIYEAHKNERAMYRGAFDRFLGVESVVEELDKLTIRKHTAVPWDKD
jgi:hypothetical protein